MVPGFESVLVSRFMELFDDGNGLRSHIEFGCKSLWSWHVYSIDGINRGYACVGKFGGLSRNEVMCREPHSFFRNNKSGYLAAQVGPYHIWKYA